MRAKNVKHVEFEILKYLLTAEGANLASPHGLTDLFIGLGADFDEKGDWVLPIDVAKDAPVQKRCLTARTNISNVLVNMLAKREPSLPKDHVDAGCDIDDLRELLKDD